MKSQFLYILGVVLVGLIGNWVLRYALRRVDGDTSASDARPERNTEDAPLPVASVSADEVLNAWGEQRISELPEGARDVICDATARVLAAYCFVGPEAAYPYISPTRHVVERRGDTFLTIGVWTTGEVVLIRLDRSDSSVYIEQFEEGCDITKVACSIDNYLRAAWHDYHAAGGT